MSTERTPGPYMVARAKTPVDGEHDYAILAHIDGKTYVIAEVFGRVSETIRPNAEATAAYIVRACNSHDALVEALKQIVVGFERLRVSCPKQIEAMRSRDEHGWEDFGQGLADARAALHAAGIE